MNLTGSQMKLKTRHLTVLVMVGLFLFSPLAVESQIEPVETATSESVGKDVSQKREARREQRQKRWAEGAPGKSDEAKGRRMGHMRRFLDFMNRFYGAVQDPYQAAGLAALSIREHHKRQGNPLGAVAPLENMLELAKDQRMRNVLLFTLRQVYEESGDAEKFLAVNEQIIRESIAAVQ